MNTDISEINFANFSMIKKIILKTVRKVLKLFAVAECMFTEECTYIEDSLQSSDEVAPVTVLKSYLCYKTIFAIK